MQPFMAETANSAAQSDHIAIRALVDRYSDAVNQRDWAAYRDTWDDDGVWVLGAPVSRTEQGINAIMTEVRRAVEGMSLFIQMPHAFTLLTLEGDRATARVTLNEIGKIDHVNPNLLNGAKGINIFAIYTDSLKKGDDGRWRFVERNYAVKLFSTVPPEGEIF